MANFIKQNAEKSLERKLRKRLYFSEFSPVASLPYQNTHKPKQKL